MISSIIVDDDPIAIEALQFLLKKHEEVRVLETFSSPIDALKFLKDEVVDLLFLDIEMPDISGLELMETAKSLPTVVFTTQSEHYALKAFEYEALDYLTKPIRYSRLNQTIQRFKDRQNIKNQQVNELDREDFFVRTDGRYVRIAFEELFYAESEDDYITLHTVQGKYVVHSTMKKLEEQLPTALFQRTHRSFIINMKKIVDVDETTVVIDRNVIPVSRAYRPLLRERLGIQ